MLILDLEINFFFFFFCSLFISLNDIRFFLREILVVRLCIGWLVMLCLWVVVVDKLFSSYRVKLYSLVVGVKTFSTTTSWECTALKD